MERRTKTDWQKLVDEYQASGRKQEEWCKEQNINLLTFRGRISKMRKAATQTKTQAKEATETEEVEWLKVKPETVSATVPSEEIRMTIGSFTVYVRPDVSEAALIRVCKALISLC